MPPGDPKAMAEGLNKLLLDPALCREMGLRARYWAEMNFSDQKMVEKYEDLLKAVSPGRNGKRDSLPINEKNGIKRTGTSVKSCCALGELGSKARGNQNT